MMAVQILTPANLGSEFDLGTLEAGKVHIKAGDGVALDLASQQLKANLAYQQVILGAGYAIAGVATYETVPGLALTLAAPGVYWLFANVTGQAGAGVANQGMLSRLVDDGVPIAGSERQTGYHSTSMVAGQTATLLAMLVVTAAPRTITVEVQKLASAAYSVLAAGTGNTLLGSIKVA
ncbi:MAG: hypothetical protein KF832_13760 [Caldilineaceae bacterium]|nr:hypothetical protein [Caldilineaceae bacterium]